MFKRKIYSELLKWKNDSNGKSALLIEGARRIGKTTMAEELGRNEYEHFYTIDFSKASENFKKNFDDLLSIEDFFSRLFLDLRISPLPRGSLIIFDEIQFCPKARQAIKSLVADGRYHYIETGSLVSIKENVTDILIPSEEETIQMYPMDYEEFLWAIGCEYEADTLLNYFQQKRVFDSKLHQGFMRNFRLYLAIGGMPKVLVEYLKSRDFYVAEKEKKKIINLYEEDLRKIDNKYGTICYRVWKQMPAMLSKHSTRFIVSTVARRANSLLIKNTMDKLEESKMLIPVFKCSDPSRGFALTKDEGMFKLYFSDIGLFVSLIYASGETDNRDIYQRLVLDKLRMNLGMLFENAAAQALIANGLEPYYYSWSQIDDNAKKKNYEIDFLVTLHGKTIPLEIKSKKASSISSFNELRSKCGKNLGDKYIVKPKPFNYDNYVINLPSYMLFALR